MTGTGSPKDTGNDRQPGVCEYPGCDEAVVQPPTGGPRRRYCSDAHRAAARRLRLRGLLDDAEEARARVEAEADAEAGLALTGDGGGGEPGMAEGADAGARARIEANLAAAVSELDELREQFGTLLASVRQLGPRRPAELEARREARRTARLETRPRSQRSREWRGRNRSWQRRAWYLAVAGVAAMVVLAIVTRSTGDFGTSGDGGSGHKGLTLSPPTSGGTGPSSGNGQPPGAGGGAGSPSGGAGTAAGGSGQGQGQNPGSSLLLVSQPSTTAPATTTKGAPPTTAAPLAARATFTALTGPGCPQDSGKGVTLDTWGTEDGSWTGDGCQGFFRWSRVAGSRYVHTFTWWFDTPLSGGQDCGLSLYIPRPSDTSLAAAPVARYTVAGASGAVGSFTLNQSTHNGTWVAAGTFHFPTACVQLTLSNQGTIDGTAVAAAPLRITCQG